MKRSRNCDYSNENKIPRAKPLAGKLQFTLLELFTGTKRKLQVQRDVLCKACEASGARPQAETLYGCCEGCGGSGIQILTYEYDDGLQREEHKCRLCWGKGSLLIPESRCINCAGKKVLLEAIFVIVNIKPGSRCGQKIIFKNEGNQEPGKRQGNVVIFLKQNPHPTFQRHNADLTMVMPLSIVESLCGFDKVVTALDGRKLRIRQSGGKIIKNNDVKYIPGGGMPFYENPSEKGKLIIKFEVNLPDNVRSRHVPTLEKCLGPRKVDEIPIEAIERNMLTMGVNEANCETTDDYGRFQMGEEEQHFPHYGEYQNEDHNVHENNYDQQFYDIPDESANNYNQQFNDISNEPANNYGQNFYNFPDESANNYGQQSYNIPEESASNYNVQFDNIQHSYDPHRFMPEYSMKEEDCESLQSYHPAQE